MTTTRHTTEGMKIQGSNFMVQNPKIHVFYFFGPCSPGFSSMFVAFGGNGVVCLFRVLLVIIYACASMCFGIPHRGQLWIILCHRRGQLGHPIRGSSNVSENSVPICRFFFKKFLFLHGCVQCFSSVYYVNSLCVQYYFYCDLFMPRIFIGTSNSHDYRDLVFILNKPNPQMIVTYIHTYIHKLYYNIKILAFNKKMEYDDKS